MKFYITPGLNAASDISNYLNSIGIDTTTDVDAVDVDSFVLMRTIEPTVRVSATEIQDYVMTYNLNTAEYLNVKFGLQGSHKLNDKWELQQTLDELNLPKIETIYPTTEIELINFFASNPKVFCKPLFYYGSIDPATDIRSLVRCDGDEFNSILDSIDIPSTNKHFYNYYTSYDEFAGDVDVQEFLRIQNTPASLPLHQCILQKDFTHSTPTWRHFIVLGYVNGSNDIIHEPYIVMPRTNMDQESYDSTQQWSTKVSFDYDSFTEQNIIDMLADRHVQGSDIYGMEQKLKLIFAHANVRNTYFTAQGYINENNEPVFFDMSTGKMSPALRRTWITPEQQLNRLKFMLDQDYDSSKIHSSIYRFWFDVRVTGGITAEKLQQAADYNVKFMLPVRSGFTRFPCTAYGNTPEEVAHNVKQYLSLCKH